MDDGDEQFQDYDDAIFDENYIEDPEQQVEGDLDLEEHDDDLDTDALVDYFEQEKELRSRLEPGSGFGSGPAGQSTEQIKKYDFPKFRTRPYLTKYEKTTLLGMRGEQLTRGAPSYTPLEVRDENGVVVSILRNEDEIAKLELAKSLLPLNIDRPIPSNTMNRPTYHTVTLRDLNHSTNPNF